jgi:protein-disulfide isomerase
MASRKEQKEQARAARIAQEQGAAAKAQRTRRLQIFGGVTAIAVIVIVVAIVVSSGGGGDKGPTSNGTASGTQLTSIQKNVSTVLNGIPQSGNTLGNPKAKVTMTYFGDLQCPICKEFTLNNFPEFVQKQVRTGNVKVVYRSFCTATCGPNYSQAQDQKFFGAQQVAALAAGKQNKFWDYTELFYHEQKEENTGYATDSFLTSLAKQIPGLNLAKWKTDRTDPSLLDQVNADQKSAAKQGLPGTPSIIMIGPKGPLLVNGGQSIPTYSDLVAAIGTVSPAAKSST